MLSSVERGQKAPTIVVLDRIADGLAVPLTQLVAAPGENRLIVRRAAEHDTLDEPGGWRRTILSPVVPGVNFESIRSTLPPNCETDEFPAYAPNSHEFIVVESGTLRLTIGDDVFDTRRRRLDLLRRRRHPSLRQRNLQSVCVLRRRPHHAPPRKSYRQSKSPRALARRLAVEGAEVELEAGRDRRSPPRPCRGSTASTWRRSSLPAPSSSRSHPQPPSGRPRWGRNGRR